MNDITIVGAGHAGLAASVCLQKYNIEHCVLERGQVGESWRSQRWNNFYMNTPNWTLNLPGKPYGGNDPDGFMAKSDFVKYLSNYAHDQHIPIKEMPKIL